MIPLPTSKIIDAAGGYRLDEHEPEAYERCLVPTIFGPIADLLISTINPHPGERALDLACGTGAVARRLVPRVGDRDRVIAVDANPDLIRFARALHAGAAIDWWIADASGLPFADRSIDVVCCSQGWQCFDRPLEVAAQLARVTVGDGRLAIAMWRPVQDQPVFATLARGLERIAQPEAAALARGPFDGPVIDRVRDHLEAAGFDRLRVRIEPMVARFPSVAAFVWQVASATPLGDLVGPELLGETTRLLGPDLSAYVDDDGLVVPMQTWVVTARNAA